MVKIEFERGVYPLVYKDTLYFTEEEFAALASSEIEAIKDERYNRWCEIIKGSSGAING